MDKKFTQQERIDWDTGEVYQQEGHRNFFKLFKQNFDALKRINGGPSYMRVFWYFLENMNMRNRLYKTQQQIAKDLEISRSYVSRILSHFEELNICVNGPGWHLMNPGVIWFGKHGDKIDRWISTKQFYDKYRIDKKYE